MDNFNLNNFNLNNLNNSSNSNNPSSNPLNIHAKDSDISGFIKALIKYKSSGGDIDSSDMKYGSYLSDYQQESIEKWNVQCTRSM